MSSELDYKNGDALSLSKRAWKECKLGDELELLYGKGLKESERKEGNYPVYGSNGVVGYHNEFLVKAPGIIVGRKGSVGEIKYSNRDFFPIDTTYYISLKNDNDIKFFYYFLLTLQLNEMNSHSAVPGLNRNDVYAIDVFLPPLPEQKAIAGVLSSLDDKIDILHRQNKTLEAMAETLFRQWFDEKEFDDTISQLITLQNGFAFKSKDFGISGENRIIKIKNISNSVIDIVNADCVDDQIVNNIQNIFKIESGDILIAMTGAEIGKLGIIPKNEKSLWLNQRVGMLKEKYRGSKYLAYLQLKSEFGQDYIENTATGSAQPNISSTSIENCGFPKLEEDQIIIYSSQLVPLYERVIFNLGQIMLLEKLRNVLLPKLMSGEVRVNV